MSDTKFAVSGQHYLFNVQAFAALVLSVGGDEYKYAFRDRTTQGVIDDVKSGASELGVLLQTTTTAGDLNRVLADNGLEFIGLVRSAPRVALPASHPLVNASELTLDDLEDFPYLYFEQESDDPAFAEEALADRAPARAIACTDRASLSELAAALNGYTITSGILVGISDGSSLATVPLATDVQLHLGYVKRKGAELGALGQKFVDKLTKKLERYARF